MREFHLKIILKIFFINPTIKWIIIAFPFDVQFTFFSFKHFFYSKFFLTTFLQFSFIKASSDFFTIQVTNNISSRKCIFNFTNNKNIFLPIWSVSFSKNVFIFWNPNMIANFEFRIFLIRIFIVFSIRIRCNANRFHFNASVNCVIVFINNII